ncbi:MAG TPA: hypothetical protein VLT86_18920 [Vicinamibacterales bacterium]|nr:hypothetical protein [Vicinamibacterales bacterium]
MRVHIDVLAWLHGLWGVFGVLSGLSLWILAFGTNLALLDLGSLGGTEHAAIWLFVSSGGLLAALGLMMMLAGWGLGRRRPAGRVAALALAVPNLVIIPFGTALGIYTFWVLLNDDARREFGRPPHGTATATRPTLERA